MLGTLETKKESGVDKEGVQITYTRILIYLV